MVKLPVGKLEIMGQIDVLEPDGESVRYPRALLISFADKDSCRAAIHSSACRFWFGEEDPNPHQIEQQRDELLEALKRIEFDWDGEAEDMAEARALLARVEASK